MKLEKGLVIAQKYTLQKEIGRGGMGSVWLADHNDLAAQVAIKVLNGGANEALIVRFRREAKATAQLRSPNVVHVSDIGVWDDRLYFVMELLEGEDLSARLSGEARLDNDATYRIIRQIARVLRKVHESGIVHRDLKPANVFLCQHDDLEIVKVLDFGIAKSTFQRSITAPGTVLGTPAYMSPEQGFGAPKVDHRSDLWSLGVMTYRMLTGKLPFTGVRGGERLRSMLRQEFTPPSQWIPELGPAVDAFFRRALHPKVEERFQNSEEFSNDLALALCIDPRHSWGSFDPASRQITPISLPPVEPSFMRPPASGEEPTCLQALAVTRAEDDIPTLAEGRRSPPPSYLATPTLVVPSPAARGFGKTPPERVENRAKVRFLSWAALLVLLVVSAGITLFLAVGRVRNAQGHIGRNSHSTATSQSCAPCEGVASHVTSYVPAASTSLAAT